MNTKQPTKIYRVEGMDCTNCAADLQKGVAKLDRVQRVHVDFASGKIHVDGAVTLAELQTRAQRLGFKVVDAEQENTPAKDAKPTRGGIIGFWDFLVARHDTRLALIGGGL
ncbi:MAG: heavy metal-associated domain-containing protein, partial [Aggregatilineales bacterium]